MAAARPRVLSERPERSKAPLKDFGSAIRLDQKTVAQWRKRSLVRNGPKASCSTVFSPKDKVMVVAFRRHPAVGVHTNLNIFDRICPEHSIGHRLSP